MKFAKERGTRSTVNYMGEKAFKLTPKMELAHAVATTFMEHAYYEKASTFQDRIREAAHRVDPLFLAQAAVYVRTEMNMRSVFPYLVVLLASHPDGGALAEKAIVRGVTRPDDMTEILAAYQQVNKALRPLSNPIKRGLRAVFGKFDAYQMARYRGEKSAITMRDVIRLIHPRPVSDEHSELIRSIIDGTLRQTETWESRLSSGENKGAVWKDMLSGRSLGYMATLRNLRNIIRDADRETVEMACEYIASPAAVRNSKQLPFRFLSAYEAVFGSAQSSAVISFEKDGSDTKDLVRTALTDAINHSMDNIPVLEGQTVILVDNSGSMRGDSGGGSPVSAHSKRKTSDIANLFGLMCWLRSDNVYFGLFGDRLIQVTLDRAKDIWENYTHVESEAGTCGAATEHGVYTAFEAMIKDKVTPDRIIIFSDQQIGSRNAWYGTDHGTRSGSFNALYQKFREMSPETTTYSIDLRGYGNIMCSDGLVTLAGWSDKIFNLLTCDVSGDRLVGAIEEMAL